MMYLADGRHVWSPAHTFGGVIDVSHWNGTINWKAVPASIVLVMIKATQGASGVDPRYHANHDGAVASGRLVVPYHFLTGEPAQAQFSHFENVAPIQHLSPVMVDWEGQPGQRPAIPIMEAFGSLVQAMIGRNPLAYHGMYDPSSPMIQTWDQMIPKYGPQPQGPKWLLWQDRPNLHLPGVPSLVDHSVFAGTETELHEWHSSGKMPVGF